MLLVSNKITAWKILHLSFTWNNPGECQMQNEFWNLGIYCCFILYECNFSQLQWHYCVSPSNWRNLHSINNPSLQSWMGNMLLLSSLCPEKWWSESWLLPASQDSFLVSSFLPVANPSSSIIQLLMSSSLHNRHSLLWLLSHVNAALPSPSVMSSLPCSAAAASASPLLVLSASTPPCWRDVGAAGRAQGLGQQDTQGLEMVEAAWVISWSPADLSVHLGWGRLDACAHLQWGYLLALHHC